MTQLKSENQVNQIDQISNNYNKWLAILGISIGIFIFALDVYIVNLALPLMVSSLNTSFATIQWVVLSYLVAIAICVLSIAKLGDMFSKKRLYIIGVIIFTISSLLCGISPNINFLIGFRALQGVGAAFLSGLGTAIIVEVFPKEERGLGLGIRAAIFGLGIMLGPTIGGILISWGGWPLIFFVNVPIGIICSLLVAYLVPPSYISTKKHNFDIIGTLIFTITLTCFTLGITLLQNQTISFNTAITLLIISGISIVIFLFIEANVLEPMLDLKIFQSLDISMGLLLRFLGNFVIAGVIFMLPFFLELVKHYPAEQVGFLLSIDPILIVLIAPLAGSLSDRFGAKIISLIGLLFIASGCWLIGTFDTQLTLIYYIWCVIPFGLGVGIFQSPNNSLVMGSTPKDQLGIASGLLALSRMLGQMLGVPIVGALFFFITSANASLSPNIDITEAPIEALVIGTQTTFRIVAIMLIIFTILAALYLWIAKNNQTSTTNN